jgi:hypothetical protein
MVVIEDDNKTITFVLRDIPIVGSENNRLSTTPFARLIVNAQCIYHYQN